MNFAALRIFLAILLNRVKRSFAFPSRRIFSMETDEGRAAFDKLMRGLVRVSKDELDAAERRHKSARKRGVAAAKKKTAKRSRKSA